MSIERLLIANRGEIAIRIMHAAAELGIETVAIHSEDDAASLHTRRADICRPLTGRGLRAYLDGERILSIARETECDAIHPGYGFLSENADFARACMAAGIVFVGPAPEALELFGDKSRARALAAECGVPVLEGTSEATGLEDARRFRDSLGGGAAVILKALAGGGGRGMRVVEADDDLDEVYERCRSEARQVLGNDDLYVERYLPRARHIEVQVFGDGTGSVAHLGERDCSIQRRHQKIVEMAPAPYLAEGLRDRITAAAVQLAEAVRYDNLGTFEFLVDADEAWKPDGGFWFIEANPRLQVEHTVTEEVTGIDLVKLQLRLAGGQSLGDLRLEQDDLPTARGFAVQVRVNMETMGADGSMRPAGGTIGAFELPFGPGVRVDSCGYVGYRTNPGFDSLLAKVIGHSRSEDVVDAVNRTYRALREFKIEGMATNIPVLLNLLSHPEFQSGNLYTRFLEDRIAELAAADEGEHRRLYFEPAAPARRAGPKVDASDPLSVLSYGKASGEDAAKRAEEAVPEGMRAVAAPMAGTIIALSVEEGAEVRAGQQIALMDAMKMEHVVQAPVSGVVRSIAVTAGDTVHEGEPLALLEEREVALTAEEVAEEIDLDAIRPDLEEVQTRRAYTRDESRPDAVARRRKTDQRTARENIADLCDPDSFVEYGALVVAARRLRNTQQELVERTPADGLVCGMGRVNGDLFADEAARCLVMSYDYTVLAGTQGKKNHQKKDRMFELAARMRLPLVFFTEGGGGRPGDTDVVFAGNLHTNAFNEFGKLSGLAPMVGITSGRCFAGNAVLLGCCDVIIATENSTIGMGGPAMIEGGGLGVYRPEEVGPMSVQTRNGVVDIAVADEAEAVAAAKRYLSYFQGPVPDWECADQRLLRRAVPENRLRVYDVRNVIETMADTGSVLELRRHFGAGMITAFVRVEGRPLGVVANNPMHLGGAIDSDAADKAARFMQLCDAFDIPLLFLCDTPGNMVGPEAEQTALVRHCCRLFVIGANVTVPFFTVVLRKAYGLGAQGMAGGGFHAPLFAVSWPTGEFGGMGLEGAVKLGYRNELAAIEDPEERRERYEEMVAKMYEQGKALNAATLFELDDVIDPADTRLWITAALRSSPPPAPRTGKKHAWIDTW